jgi:transglutaminase-like putative cysteine protease
MIYNVLHRTTYNYSEPVSLSHHILRVRPRASKGQRVLSSVLRIEPVPMVSTQFLDTFGNATMFVSIENGHQQLIVDAESTVEVFASPTIDNIYDVAWEAASTLRASEPLNGALEASEFAYESPLVKTDAEYAAYARVSFQPGRPLMEAALDLTERIFKEFKFDPTATTVSTPLHEVFRNRRGVCQDFAHFQIACLRSLGLPARYVSGYLETDPPPGKPKLVGSDASHAWASIFCPGAGWVDLDPTNNVIPGTRHITVGWGRDYSDISPVRGVILGGGKHKLSVAVDVTRV